MKIKDALAILNIQSHPVTSDDIKTAYQKAVSLYHPDRNPAGLEMMKLIHMAYAALKDYEGTFDETDHPHKNYGETLNNALNAILDLGLDIEICGTWIWVSGDTKPHRETLKLAGYRWSPPKSCWYFRPEENKSYNRSSWAMDKIRQTYGNQAMKNKEKRLISSI